MPEPEQPRYAPVYEPSFDGELRALGLGGPSFDYFFREVEAQICTYPWENSTPVPDGDGIRMQGTENAWPDIPPLYLYFRVEQDPNRVVFLGVSPAWSRT